MTRQEHTKALLIGVSLLFLALVASGVVFYYFHHQERAETAPGGAAAPASPAAPSTAGTVDTKAAGIAQPGSPAATLPVIAPSGPQTDAPRDTPDVASGAEEFSAADQATGATAPGSNADAAPPASEALPETPAATPGAETPEQAAQAQPEAPALPADQGAAVLEPAGKADSQSGAAAPPTNQDAVAPKSAADSAAAQPFETPGGSGVVLYGRGKPITPDGQVVRGDIPAGQESASASLSPSGQDSIVSAALVRDLAAFLAANYWPAGTHPMAQNRGISTVGVQWLNHRYGGQLHGFTLTRDNPSAARERVLQYAFMPSMLRALHRLYGERFFAALRAEAAAQRRGPAESPLTRPQIAEMFGIYAGMAEGLAGAVRAYADTPQIRSLVVAHAKAAAEAAEAYAAFAESRERSSDAAVSRASQIYQDALKRREQAKTALAAAMRGGEGIDAESLVYTAHWLYRRGENIEATLHTLAEILDASALHLATMQQEYLGSPAEPRR